MLLRLWLVEILSLIAADAWAQSPENRLKIRAGDSLELTASNAPTSWALDTNPICVPPEGSDSDNKPPPMSKCMLPRLSIGTYTVTLTYKDDNKISRQRVYIQVVPAEPGDLAQSRKHAVASTHDWEEFEKATLQATALDGRGIIYGRTKSVIVASEPEGIFERSKIKAFPEAVIDIGSLGGMKCRIEDEGVAQIEPNGPIYIPLRNALICRTGTNHSPNEAVMTISGARIAPDDSTVFVVEAATFKSRTDENDANIGVFPEILGVLQGRVILVRADAEDTVIVSGEQAVLLPHKTVRTLLQPNWIEPVTSDYLESIEAEVERSAAEQQSLRTSERWVDLLATEDVKNRIEILAELAQREQITAAIKGKKPTDSELLIAAELAMRDNDFVNAEELLSGLNPSSTTERAYSKYYAGICAFMSDANAAAADHFARAKWHEAPSISESIKEFDSAVSERSVFDLSVTSAFESHSDLVHGKTPDGSTPLPRPGNALATNLQSDFWLFKKPSGKINWSQDLDVLYPFSPEQQPIQRLRFATGVGFQFDSFQDLFAKSLSATITPFAGINTLNAKRALDEFGIVLGVDFPQYAQSKFRIKSYYGGDPKSDTPRTYDLTLQEPSVAENLSLQAAEYSYSLDATVRNIVLATTLSIRSRLYEVAANLSHRELGLGVTTGYQWLRLKLSLGLDARSRKFTTERSDRIFGIVISSDYEILARTFVQISLEQTSQSSSDDNASFTDKVAVIGVKYAY